MRKDLLSLAPVGLPLALAPALAASLDDCAGPAVAAFLLEHASSDARALANPAGN